jgi:hypothetical protein
MRTISGGKLAVGIAATTLMLALAAAPAVAHDHRPPKTRAGVDGVRLPGLLNELTWTRRFADGTCVTQISEFGQPFPGTALTVPPGSHTIRVRFFKDRRPAGVNVLAWTALEASGFPAGEPSSPDFTLRPRRRHGEVRFWTLSIPVEVGAELALIVNAAWRDNQGCRLPQSIGKGYRLRAG